MTEQSTSTDEGLINAICNHDREAFSELLDRHLNRIHGYLQRMTGCHADAEDLTQETFLRVWQKAGSYQAGRVQVSTWLHTIAHNLCIDSLRKKTAINMNEMPEVEDELADPMTRTSALEQQQILDLAIQRLPENQRSAILLCQLQGFSNAQAAAILRINTRALESLLARARRTLREHLFSHSPGDQSEANG